MTLDLRWNTGKEARGTGLHILAIGQTAAPQVWAPEHIPPSSASPPLQQSWAIQLGEKVGVRGGKGAEPALKPSETALCAHHLAFKRRGGQAGGVWLCD